MSRTDYFPPLTTVTTGPSSPPDIQTEITTENIPASSPPDIEAGSTAVNTPAVTPGNPTENGAQDAAAGALSHKSNRDDIFLVVFIAIMLIWPWVFFGVIWKLNGVRMNNSAAKTALDNPHATTYFITLIGSVISMIISSLFSLAIIRFAQEWVTKENPVQVFHVTVLSAVRHQTWPWGTDIKSLQNLFHRGRWWPATLLLFSIAIFAFVTSSTTSLVTPIQFNQPTVLNATELDFSSNTADCVAWFGKHPLANECNWQSFNGTEYTSCLAENQMVDVLESGRGNILESLANNSQSLTFSQLGNDDGLHFLGSIRGVLPIGPNGVPAFDTLKNSPFSNPELRAAMISYNYTLEHQGFSTNITCTHDTSSPIVYSRLQPNTSLVLQYSSSCDGLAQVLTNVTFLQAVNSNHTLLFWACQSPPNAAQAPSYFIYLRGYAGYADVVGNITCTVSQSSSTLFPVTYQSIPRVFSSSDPIATSATTMPFLIEEALVGLSSFMAEAQTWQSHQLVESVITVGVKSLGLPPDKPHPRYLDLYAAILQGILDYEATYIRLIYSTVVGPPPSCVRTVSGLLSSEVFGWFVQAQNIGYLLPMTIVNLASLGILICAMCMAKRSTIRFDPTDPREILYRANVHKDPVPGEWADKVEFDKAKVIQGHFESDVEPNLKEGLGDVLNPS